MKLEISVEVNEGVVKIFRLIAKSVALQLMFAAIAIGVAVQLIFRWHT